VEILSQLSFGAPWLLLGLLALPVIWLLLRVTPPAPRRQVFPPLRLLAGLINEEQTPAKTPWWLLLRLAAAALLVLALADPVLGRGLLLSARGPLVLVVDNGWTAADGWGERARAITELLHRAGDRPVAILPTASARPSLSGGGLLNEGEAERIARGLTPMPWPGDRAQVQAALARMKFTAAPSIVWLSDGIEDGNARKFLAALKARGETALLTPERAAMGLLPPGRDGSGFTIAAIRPATARSGDVEAAALGANGETLAAATLHFGPQSGRAEGHLTLPLEVRNRTQRIALRGQESAGAVQLLDTGNVRRRAGLVGAGSGEQSLLADTYYLERALAPYAEVAKGNVTSLLAAHVSVLVLADIGRIAGADAPKVSDFVKNGGVLVRFAGEHMAQGADDLVPVRLRVGERYLGGAMAWSQPQHLADFTPDSPFNGLAIPADVTVSRQILAEPAAELGGHVWARLADGTPLVTARQDGKGWIILFHTAASPGWSTLPLSGLYVDMLRRLLALAGGAPAESLAGLTTLPPVAALDGFGHLGAPGGEAMPIAARDFARTQASAAHPPGLYGAQGVESALNVLRAEDALLPLPDLPVERHAYGAIDARALEPMLLLAAALLLLLDALCSLLLRGHRPRRLLAGAAGLALALMIAPSFLAGAARADDATNMKAALDTRLAYVKTGLPDIDMVSQEGLAGLGLLLKSRTSYEPLEPIGVDLERDDLSFYPLLYWPMDPRERNLSAKALAKVADYMRQGGTILFDTRDLSIGAPNAGQETLRRLTRGLDIPPLQKVPSDHVLSKSFYLLRDFPGRWSGAPVWVEALPPERPGQHAPARGGDGVSPVIIGGNDWAAAWAVDMAGRHFLFEPVPGGESQREMAFRFGVNVVMYALTGNYKTDQVHAPALLERLGREK
jgi:hypothetical protein